MKRKIVKNLSENRNLASERVKSMAEGFKKLYGGPSKPVFDVESEKKPVSRPFGTGKFGR